MKPDNILITREGRVKILDFGLAKAAHREIAADDATRTVAVNITDPGTTIGTIAYMSPEQARGDVNLTPQSDQFSLGLVLYELASGKKAFQRGSAAEIMTAIIREDAEPLPAGVPAPFRWIVERLLHKEPAERHDSTRDLYRELRQVRDRLSESVSVSMSASAIPAAQLAVPQRSGRNWVALALIAAVISAVSVLGTLFFAPRPHRADSDLYTPIEISLEHPADASWSPDVKAFTYSALLDAKRQIFVRYLNSPLSTRLTNLSSGAKPLGWAPDGKRIFFAAANPAGGQPPQALFALSVTGGEPELLMPLDVIVRSGALQARVSPDGKVLLARRREADGTISLSISAPVGSPWKRYAPAPFESKQTLDFPSFDLSPDGKKIVYFFNNGVEAQSWLLPFPNGTGTPKRILQGRLGSSTTFSWFPDSRHIAASSISASRDTRPLWMLDMSSNERKPITGGLVNEGLPAVSPDGQRMLFLESASEFNRARPCDCRTIRTERRAPWRGNRPYPGIDGSGFLPGPGVQVRVCGLRCSFPIRTSSYQVPVDRTRKTCAVQIEHTDRLEIGTTLGARICFLKCLLNRCASCVFSVCPPAFRPTASPSLAPCPQG